MNQLRILNDVVGRLVREVVNSLGQVLWSCLYDVLYCFEPSIVQLLGTALLHSWKPPPKNVNVKVKMYQIMAASFNLNKHTHGRYCSLALLKLEKYTNRSNKYILSLPEMGTCGFLMKNSIFIIFHQTFFTRSRSF